MTFGITVNFEHLPPGATSGDNLKTNIPLLVSRQPVNLSIRQYGAFTAPVTKYLSFIKFK